MAAQTWVSIIVPPVGIILSFLVFAYQVYRARFNQQVDLLFRLEGDFFGPAKRKQRVKASRDLLAGKTLEAEPILDFFETMALLLRKGALDKEMVWHTFFHWIDPYFEATKVFIEDRQKVDPDVWKDLTDFVAQLRAYQATRLGGRSYLPPSREKVDLFLQEELTEDEPGKAT